MGGHLGAGDWTRGIWMAVTERDWSDEATGKSDEAMCGVQKTDLYFIVN
jgi:hypothetical protein